MSETSVVPANAEQVIDALFEGLAVQEIDADEVTIRIGEQILRAETVEDVFSSGEATSAQSNLGRPFMLRDVRSGQSRFKDGPSRFAVLDVVWIDTGEQDAVTTSMLTVMMRAARLKQIGKLPIAVKIESAGLTGSGNERYTLLLAE